MLFEGGTEYPTKMEDLMYLSSALLLYFKPSRADFRLMVLIYVEGHQ